MGKTRDAYFDVVKAVAIIMVVFCHVMTIAPTGMFPLWINNFRVGMNMPIFFIISGYFAWPTIEVCDWNKLCRHIRSWLQPAMFAGVVYTAIDIVIGSTDHSLNAIITRLFRSIFVDPWFITTLIECYLLLFVAWRVSKRIRGTLLGIASVMLIIMACSPFMPGNIHWACVLNMMPHFAFGAIVLRKSGCRIWESRISGILCFAIFLAFVLIEGDVQTNGMSFYTADSSLHTFGNVKSAMCFVLRPIVGICGAIGVMAMMRMLIGILPFIGGGAGQNRPAYVRYIHISPLAAPPVAQYRVDWKQSYKCNHNGSGNGGSLLVCHMALDGEDGVFQKIDLG